MILQNLNDIINAHKINLSEDNILELLKIQKRWPLKYPWGQNTIQIISNVGSCESFFFFNADGYIDYQKWLKFYNLGYTTILSNILDLTDQLRDLNKKLTEASGLNFVGNFYFSKPGQTPSFSKHHHDYNVIVKQIYGETEWIIDEKVFFLQANDTCIIPKNRYHQVISKQNKKLSLTLNLT